MISKILVPLDGTKLAEKALPHAIRLANKCGATLLLKQVVYVNNFDEAILSWEGLQKTEMEALQGGETYLAKMKEFITNPHHKLHILAKRVDTLVGYGKPIEIISELVEIEKVDLIVMTTHGRSSFSQLVVGSTATEVVRHSPVPVMLIRPDRHLARGEVAPDLETLLNQPADPGLERPSSRGRILLTLDGYEYAEKALGIATELATTFGADLYLLEVIASTVPIGYGVGYGGFMEEVRRSTAQEDNQVAHHYLTKIQKRLDAHNLRCIKTVRTGNPSDEITEYANKIHPMCIVMATHAPGRIERTFIGSTAQNVLHQSHLPVVMVHPTTSESAMTKASQTTSETTDSSQPH